MGDFAVNAAGEPRRPATARRFARVRRWCLYVGAFASLPSLAAVGWLWLRSYHSADWAEGYNLIGSVADVQSVRGHIVVGVLLSDRPTTLFGQPLSAWQTSSEGLDSYPYAAEHEWGDWLYDPSWRHAAFDVPDRVFLGWHSELTTWPHSPSTREHALAVPDWFLAAAFAVLPWRAVRRWRSARRGRLAGRCRQCGYDLRATPGRCPECGTPATVPATSSQT